MQEQKARLASSPKLGALLAGYVFKSIEQVQHITEDCLRICNEQRPHDALGGLPPKQFLPRLTTAADSSNRLST